MPVRHQVGPQPVGATHAAHAKNARGPIRSMSPGWAQVKQPRRPPLRRYGRIVAMPEASETDFAIVVFREDDGWEAGVLPVAVNDDLTGFIRVLRQQPSLAGTIGLA